MQALLGYPSEARWIRHARAHLGHLFGYLPGQPGYNRRLRAAAGLITALIRLLAADTSLWADDVWVIDSTPVECGRSRDTARRSDLAGWAEYGYCASHSRYFWGCGCTWSPPSAVFPWGSRSPAPKPTNARPSWESWLPTRRWPRTGPGRLSLLTGTTTAPSSRPPWPRSGCGYCAR